MAPWPRRPDPALLIRQAARLARHGWERDAAPLAPRANRRTGPLRVGRVTAGGNHGEAIATGRAYPLPVT